MKKKTLLMSVSALALICGVASCGHEHEFGTDWQKDATNHWHAAVCEHTEEVADKAAHTWDAGTVTKEATEEAKGEKTFKCTVCGATKTEEVAQLEHTHKFGTEWTKDATDHWHAATCTHTTEIADKTGHSWDAGTVTTQPTLSAEGEKTYECTVCGYEKVEAVEKLEAKLVLSAADLETGDIAPGTVVEKNGFTLITDNPDQAAEKIDKKLTVQADESATTIGEETFTQRIKTNGGSSTTVGAEERVISFTTTGKGKVKIYAKHGSSDTTKPAAKVSVFNVDNGVGHDSVEIAVGAAAAVYELELHYAGQFYIASTQNISIYKIEVTWEDGVDDTSWAPTVELADPNVLNVTDVSPRTIEEDVTWGNFVINAGTKADDQEVVVDIGTSAKTYDGVSYTGRLKLGGEGTADYRSVTINTTGAATITIVVTSSSSSADRTANLFAPDGTKVMETDATVPGSGVVGLLFEVPAAGAYNFRVTGGAGGANIYAIMIEAGVVDPNPTPTPNPEPTPNPNPNPGALVDYSIDFTNESITASDAGTTVTSNFKTAETFGDGKFVLTSSSSNMLVESGKGLKFQQTDASITFTLEETASVTILLYSSADDRSFIFASTAESWEEDTIARIDTEVSNNGTISSADNVITLTYANLAAGTYTIAPGGKYTLYIQSISVDYPGN